MEQYFHKGQTHRIIARSLDELGLDEAYLKWRLGYEKDARVDFRSNRLAATEWFLICQVLHIDVNSIQYGYCRRVHRVRVGTAYELGQLVLPRTRQLKLMLREVRASRRQSARWEAMHYGFRLRWRIRRRRWIGLGPSTIKRLWTQLKSRLQLRHEIERLATERRSIAEADNGPEMKAGLPGDALFILGGAIPLCWICWTALRHPNSNQLILNQESPIELFVKDNEVTPL